MTHSQTPRILAIEARRSRFGYALFEGPKRLLDWGASTVPSELTGHLATKAARKRIASALRRCHPAAAVVRHPRRIKTSGGVTPGPIIRAIRREAALLDVPVYFITRAEVQEAFRMFQGKTKEQVAEILVGIFPELFSRLPSKRKKWQPEFRGMIVFDAVAIGFAHWHRNGTQTPAPE
jgi:hypothetical protein